MLTPHTTYFVLNDADRMGHDHPAEQANMWAETHRTRFGAGVPPRNVTSDLGSVFSWSQPVRSSTTLRMDSDDPRRLTEPSSAVSAWKTRN